MTDFIAEYTKIYGEPARCECGMLPVVVETYDGEYAAQCTDCCPDVFPTTPWPRPHDAIVEWDSDRVSDAENHANFYLADKCAWCGCRPIQRKYGRYWTLYCPCGAPVTGLTQADAVELWNAHCAAERREREARRDTIPTDQSA